MSDQNNQPTQQEVTDLLREFIHLITEAKKIKARLAKLKATILKGCFAEQGDGKEGTENLVLFDFFLKRVCKIDRKVTGSEDEIYEVRDQLKTEAARERLFIWKPEISVKEYKLLSPEERKMVDTVLTIKNASPTLAIEGDATKD
jgi:hypothetical protein